MLGTVKTDQVLRTRRMGGYGRAAACSRRREAEKSDLDCDARIED